MRTRIRNISANTFQLLLNQGFGLVIFYILSKELDKNTFGKVSWALAVLLIAFNILTLGLDQVLIKRVASGKDPSTLLSLYFFHVVLTGLSFVGLLGCIYLIMPATAVPYDLLLLIGIGKLMIFFSAPFKQLAAGLENFTALLYMSVASNIIRGSLLVIFSFTGTISISQVIIIFICGDFIEFILAWFVCRKMLHIPFNSNWHFKTYLSLLKDSMPQAGVAIFACALARLDWILIGTLSTNIKLAEYSFSYKVFEAATLPLLVIAPLLLPAFTKFFGSSKISMRPLHSLLRVEMALSTLVAMCLYLLWTPLIDAITGGRYGAVNQGTILVLGLAMPFMYMSNFLWSILFANGRMKRIFWVFLITFIVNLIADIILIPLYGNEGAAAGFLLAMAAQCAMYLAAEKRIIHDSLWSVILCPACAVICIMMSKLFFENPYLSFGVAILSFLSLLLVMKQLRLIDIGLMTGIGTLEASKATEGTPQRID